jgi:Domain of unknown function (DUF4189)
VKLPGWTKVVVRILAAAPIVAVPLVAQADEQHGALAYSEATHQYGWASALPTQDAAEQRALSQCGADCTIRLSWQDGCAAYAQAFENTHFGWAVAGDRDSVEAEAIRMCREMGGDACTIRVWDCN